MLSDSLFETLEALWKDIRHYTYSDAYRAQLIDGITELALVIETLDYPDDARPMELRRRIMREKMEARWNEFAESRDGDCF